MKILIIGTRFAPIPCVCNGAIESLTDEYIKYNSKTKKNQITVYSLYDGKITDELLDKYNCVDFRYVNKEKIRYKVLRLICGVMRKFWKNKFGDEFIRTVKQDLKKAKEIKKYDKIIILNNINNITYISKHFFGKKILYLHNDYLNVETKNCYNILNSLDEVWCVSNFIKKQVDGIFKNNKSIVLYNGTKLDEFEQSVSQFELEKSKKYFNIHEDDFVVMYTGRVMKEKGVKELIEAFKIFSIEKENCKLIVVGGPTDFSKKYYEELKDKCKDSRKKIFFIGNVGHDVINILYKFINVQVVPSMWNEAFGLTVVEGMVAGVPLIVSDSGGIPELVEENCAVVVKRNDIVNELVESLNEIYNNKELRKTLIANAKKRVKQFSIEDFQKNIEKLLLKKE